MQVDLDVVADLLGRYGVLLRSGEEVLEEYEDENFDIGADLRDCEREEEKLRRWMRLHRREL